MKHITKKRIIMLALMAILLIGLQFADTVNGVTAEGFADGLGTSESPWIINDATQLDLLRNYTGDENADKYFKLGSDIDLSGFLVGSDTGWEPIGDTATNFYGHLDGDGYVVQGLWIVKETNDTIGLFGYVNGSNISNLGVEIAATGVVGHTNIGGVVGYQSGGSIKNSYVTGKVTGTDYVGGLVGQQASANITNSYGSSSVNGGVNVGGLVGKQNTGSITNSYAFGKITGTNGTGGLVGEQVNSINTNNFFDTETTGQTNGVGNVENATGVIALTTEQMVADNALSDTMPLGTTFQKRASGSKYGYYVELSVFYARGIAKQSVQVEKRIPILSNVSATSITSGEALVTSIISGTATDSITNINIEGTWTWTNEETIPSTSGDYDITFTPSNTSMYQATTGSVVLSVDDSPSDSTETTPSISVMITAEGFDSGLGTSASPWIIKTAAQLDLMRNYLGGANADKNFKLGADIDLTSYLASGGAGYTKWTTSGWEPIGTSATDNQFYGHFSGANYAVKGLWINRTTTDNVGLFGYVHGSNISNLGVEIATVGVKGRGTVGGLVGRQNSGSITNSFFDIEKTGQTNGVGNNASATGVTGLTTAQMVASDTLSSSMPLGNAFQKRGSNDDYSYYPELKVFATSSSAIAQASSELSVRVASNGSFACGAGTSTSPWLITTPKQLDLMRNYLGSSNVKYFKLGNDIDLTSYLASDGAGYTKWTTSGWLPIGESAVADQFCGHFDGANFVVKGLWINRTTTDNVGLFGYVNGSNISNLRVEIEAAGVKGKSYIDSLVGYQTGASSITKSYTTGAVTGTSYIGGLVGQQSGGSITNSYTTGTVSGSLFTGGLEGWQSAGSITNSYATGAVTASILSGGLVGTQEGGSITNSFFDIETTGQTNGVGSSASATGVTGLTTAQMVAANTLTAGAKLGNAFQKRAAGTTYCYYPELTVLYAKSEASVRVTRRTISVSSSATAITYGQTLSNSTLSGVATDSASKAVVGGFSWVNGTTTYPTTTGMQPFTFVPTYTDLYKSAIISSNVSVTVDKATPNPTTPSGITAGYGQTLNDITSQLTAFNNTGGVDGTYSWQSAGTTSVGAVGINTFTVVYTPSDTTNYNSVTCSVSVVVIAPYYVIIPTKVEFGTITKTKYSTLESRSLEIKVGNIKYLNGQTISTSLVSDFKLKAGNSAFSYNAYNQGGTSLSTGATFAEFTTNGVKENDSSIGSVKIDRSLIPAEGKYSGTITFNIGLK